MGYTSDPERRMYILTRAARAFGLSALREDPSRFATLLERTIGQNKSYFVPEPGVGELSVEARRLHGGRLEALIDEAVDLAAQLYPGRRRDTALLSIAVHAERLMDRLKVDPWGRGALFVSSLTRPPEPERETKIWGSLGLVRSRVCFEES